MDTKEFKSRKHIRFYEYGDYQKYRVTLTGEMQVNNMNVINTVVNNFILRVKNISHDDIVKMELITYDKEMVATTNPAFKEMFAVTRQFEKLYDEVMVGVEMNGKVLSLYNMDTIQEKWTRLKNENIPYFNENTDIEEFFKINEANIANEKFWLNILNEQEFFFLFFSLAGYGHKFSHVQDIERSNAFKNGKIKWEIRATTSDNQSDDITKRVDIEGWFDFSKSWVQKTYGEMPFLKERKLTPKFQIEGYYVFDLETGWINRAEIYQEETVDKDILFHKMKYVIEKI